MKHYCTLFDFGYFSRGLALYDSLCAHEQDFELTVFAFDEMTEHVLRKMQLKFLKVISLKDFEDEELLKVKPTRTRAEYCWTATPSVLLYMLEKVGVTECTYLDADLYFYSSPKELFQKMGNQSILITDHHYAQRYDQSSTSGRFCVQFMTFKKDEHGLKALQWWRERCLEWCFARNEDGKFGDQRYLEDWPERFSGVHISEHHGAGLAVWNLLNYSFQKNKNQIYVTLKEGVTFPLVFYHFHGLRLYTDGVIDFGKYVISDFIKNEIYNPYIAHLKRIEKNLKASGISANPHAAAKRPTGLRETLRRFKRLLRGEYNVMRLP